MLFRSWKWIYLPWKLSGEGWFFVVGAFNRPGMVATLGMSKNKHLKVLVENKNEVLEVVPGKARMVHVFAEKMIIKKLGEKMKTQLLEDEGEDSRGGEQK